MNPSLERSIAERAATQLGHITIQQLVDRGVSRRSIRHLIERGRLTPVGQRTLRIPGLPASFASTVMAACLDLGAVASHRTAAHLHALAGFSGQPPVVEVTGREGIGSTRSTLATVHRTTNLPADDLVAIGPIPATSVARTIFGLAALVPDVDEESVRDVIDTAVRDGRASDRWLWWRLERLRCRGRDGVAALEGILEDRAGRGRTESWLEREFLRCLDRGGLPRPVVQRRIRAKGAFLARVDCCYERERIVIEVNGHGSPSTKRQRATDAARVNRLQLAGHRVLQFGYDDVVRTPEVVIATVTEALVLSSAA
jgi:hypothetical protein